MRQNQPDTDPAFFMPTTNSSGITGLRWSRIGMLHARAALLIQLLIRVFVPGHPNDRPKTDVGFSCPAV